MKKKVFLAVILTGCMMAAPIGVSAAEGDAAVETEAATEENAADAGASEADGAVLSDDLYDFQMEIQGEVYQFPMTYEEFTAKGWTLRDEADAEEKLGTNSYSSFTFEKGDLDVYAYVINLKINECTVSEGLVAGLSADLGFADIDVAAQGIKTAKGITMGVSNVDDIKAAYGEPSDTYDSDMYTKLGYERDMYQEYEFYVFKESNTLLEVSMRNFVEPEGFDKGSVSTEAPDIVTAYEAPTELGKELLDPVVEYCGDLYAVPCPVTALQANGWELKDVAEDAFVEGDGIDFIEMMRDNQTIRLTVYNLTENAVTMENCFVTEFQVATYDSESMSIKVSGDYTLGADKLELIAAAKEKGFQYEDEDGYLTIYADDDHKLDTRLEVWFNKDESETAAASLTYRNEIPEK